MLPLKQVAYIKASNAEAYDHFACGGGNQGHTGTSIALNGDGTTMAIGAPFESGGAAGVNGNQHDNSVYASGAVYVFVRQGDSWTQQAYVKASNPGQSDHFGSSVALSRDGNTMAVAAHWEVERGYGHQRQSERQLDPAVRRGLRLHPQRHHLDAAGVHQGVEHRQARKGDVPATATSSASRCAERRRQHAGGRRHQRRQRGATDQRQPGRRLGAVCRRRVRVLAERHHVGAAGLHQERRTWPPVTTSAIVRLPWR